ncbi:hypothetical protein JVU11DRAFT_6998 [Chiua virens]|nr:hypothetical protein JVU11DRAFT_6998 [Chiua virens]
MRYCCSTAYPPTTQYQVPLSPTHSQNFQSFALLPFFELTEDGLPGSRTAIQSLQLWLGRAVHSTTQQFLFFGVLNRHLLLSSSVSPKNCSTQEGTLEVHQLWFDVFQVLVPILMGNGPLVLSPQTFVKSPGPQDWERPLRYAEFVRVIGPTRLVHARAKRYMLPPSVLDTLVKSCPVPPLFRRLETLDHAFISFPGWTFDRQLAIDSQVALETAYLFELSNPAALRKLKFAFRTRKSKDAARALLTRLVEYYATIESLDVMNGPVRTDLQLFDYLVPIGSLQHLTSFALSTLELDSLLCSDLPTEMPLDALFPAILELFLRCSSSSTHQALKVIHSPNLRTLRLGLNNQENPDELCAFITSRAAWQHSLQSISIASPPVSTQAVECLLGLTRLRNVSLNGSNLDDNILQRIAQAWPALEHLNLTYREYPSEDSARATLNSLVSFCKLCPHFVYLQIEVDASLIPPLVHVPTDTSQGDLRAENTRNQLRLVILPSSSIRDPVAVAQFLSDLSPRITLSIPAMNPDDTNRNRLSPWERVVEIMGERGQVFPPISS